MFFDLNNLEDSLRLCVKECPRRTITTVEDLVQYEAVTGVQLCRYVITVQPTTCFCLVGVVFYADEATWKPSDTSTLYIQFDWLHLFTVTISCVAFFIDVIMPTPWRPPCSNGRSSGHLLVVFVGIRIIYWKSTEENRVRSFYRYGFEFETFLENRSSIPGRFGPCPLLPIPARWAAA
jgi:hypothetical protein